MCISGVGWLQWQLGLDVRPEAYFDLVPWQVGGGMCISVLVGACVLAVLGGCSGSWGWTCGRKRTSTWCPGRWAEACVLACWWGHVY